MADGRLYLPVPLPAAEAAARLARTWTGELLGPHRHAAGGAYWLGLTRPRWEQELWTRSPLDAPLLPVSLTVLSSPGGEASQVVWERFPALPGELSAWGAEVEGEVGAFLGRTFLGRDLAEDVTGWFGEWLTGRGPCSWEGNGGGSDGSERST